MQQRLKPIILESINFVELDEQDRMPRLQSAKNRHKKDFHAVKKTSWKVNTRNHQETTASEPDHKKSILHDDNIMPHQQQPRLNFVFDDFVTAQTRLFNSASAPAASSFAISSSFTAAGGST